MPELVSFEDAANELDVTTEELSGLVSSGKLQTAEQGGLLMITRESLDAHKGELGPVRLAASEPVYEEALPTIALAAEETAPEAAPEPAVTEPVGEKTESIFGDEGFELETFEEVGAPAGPGQELAELEEAGEELGAEEAAALSAREQAPARLRAMAARPQTSTGVSVMLVLTFILLIFAGVVVFNFAAELRPQYLVKPVHDFFLSLIK